MPQRAMERRISCSAIRSRGRANCHSCSTRIARSASVFCCVLVGFDKDALAPGLEPVKRLRREVLGVLGVDGRTPARGGQQEVMDPPRQGRADRRPSRGR